MGFARTLKIIIKYFFKIKNIQLKTLQKQDYIFKLVNVSIMCVLAYVHMCTVPS